jgi:hypothetical protein
MKAHLQLLRFSFSTILHFSFDFCKDSLKVSGKSGDASAANPLVGQLVAGAKHRAFLSPVAHSTMICIQESKRRWKGPIQFS